MSQLFEAFGWQPGWTEQRNKSTIFKGPVGAKICTCCKLGSQSAPKNGSLERCGSEVTCVCRVSGLIGGIAMLPCIALAALDLFHNG